MKSSPVLSFSFLFTFFCCSVIPNQNTFLTSDNLPSIEGSAQKRIRYEFTGKEFLIATDHPLASEAGLQVWKQGGNVVDAFVAASFAISVLRPHSTGLLGGGFAIVYFPGKVKKAFDFRERASGKVSSEYYQRLVQEGNTEITRLGPYAQAVPGLVQGLLRIQKSYGKLSLQTVLEPALRYSRNGFSVYGDLAAAVTKVWPNMNPEMRKQFGIDNRPIREGELLIQESVALLLERLAANKEEEFRHGETVSKILSFYNKYDSFFTASDFEGYQVFESDPLQATSWGHQILTMPPPSSAAHLITMMNIYETAKSRNSFPKGKIGEWIRLTESMRVAYRDRATWGGDPRFSDLPVKDWISPEYAYEETREIEKKLVSGTLGTPEKTGAKKDSYNTTHISVLDKDGNAVSSTQSINGVFGAAFVIPGTGLVANNTMDDFSLADGIPNLYGLVGSKNNSLAAGKTPLSSMSPMILTDADGRTKIAIGAPGGSQIPTSLFNVLYHYIQKGNSLYDSVAYPRFHHQYVPDTLLLDPEYKNVYPLAELPFYTVQWNRHRAKVFAIVREGESLIGVSDPKGEGIPLGL